MKQNGENSEKSSLFSGTKEAFLAKLNPQQSKAVESAPDSPLLIVAGAGTGKTRALTSRVAYFLRLGGGVERICAITFTNKAAREMEERIGKPGKGHFIGTFHSLGAKILRKHATFLGRSADFVIFDDHDSFALVKKVLNDLNAKKESPALIRDRISERKSAIPGEEKAQGKDEKFEEIFSRYEEGLRRANAFDFDDLLHKTVLILSKREDIRRIYQEWFRHVFVDEYQDVNPIQYELVKLLVGGGASLSVVGDAEQTIYGWRGSDIDIFLRFPEEWSGARMVTLTQNYRSAGNILKAAGGVISQNVYDTKVERAINLWTENPPGDPVVIHETFDEDSEAEWIGNQVAADPRRETGILYRTNAQSRAIEQALLRRRIPYRVYGGLKFYERREVKDVLAGVRWALNPGDEVSRERLEKAFNMRTFRALAAAFETFRAAAANEPPAKIVELFLDASDYTGLVERSMTNPRDRIENIEELLRFAGEFQAASRFLEEVALLQATDNVGQKGIRGRQESEIRANLMTIHLAKGLEFDRVFVAGCTEGLLPHARSIQTEQELQEERRLMYVAMTRARAQLFLSFYGIPSRFLGEIPEDAVRFESEHTDDPLPFDHEERYITFD